MAIRMTKPWTPLAPDAVKKLSGQLGVFHGHAELSETVPIDFDVQKIALSDAFREH